MTISLNGFNVEHHQRERFINSPFAPSQLCNRFFIRGITGKMKTAETFDGDIFLDEKF